MVALDVQRSRWGICRLFQKRSNKRAYKHHGIFALAQNKGAGEIFINHIDRDGTQEGFDTKLISAMSSRIDIPLIICGGAGDYEDLKTAVDAGASAAAAGVYFVFYGRTKFNYDQLPRQGRNG